MKNLLFGLCTALILALPTVAFHGCSSSRVGSGEPIPENAIDIRVYADEAPDAYFATIKRRLENWGFIIDNYSPVNRNFVTMSTDVGRRVSLAINLVSVELDSNQSGTIAVFFGRTPHGTAQWKTAGGDESFAFEKMASFIETIPHDRLEYGTTQ